MTPSKKTKVSPKEIEDEIRLSLVKKRQAVSQIIDPKLKVGAVKKDRRAR